MSETPRSDAMRSARSAGKLITVVLPRGRGAGLLRQLKAEKGITTACLNHARGVSSTSGDARGSNLVIREKDVVTVVVGEEAAETVFGYLYEVCGIGEGHGGFLYQAPLPVALPLVLPEGLPEER